MNEQNKSRFANYEEKLKNMLTSVYCRIYSGKTDPELLSALEQNSSGNGSYLSQARHAAITKVAQERNSRTSFAAGLACVYNHEVD